MWSAKTIPVSSIGKLNRRHSCEVSYQQFAGNDPQESNQSTFTHKFLSNTSLMFDEKRYMTSMVYLSCLASTLVLLFIPMPHSLKLLLLILLTLFQFCASCWYSLSYIPYGRKTALRVAKKALGIEGDYSMANILA